MKYKFFVLIGIVVLALVAVGLTEVTMLVGRGGGQIADDVLHRPARLTSVTPSPTPSASLSPTPPLTPMPTAALTPQATVTPRPVGTAITSSFVRLRAGASVDTRVVAELSGGTLVTLGEYRDASWQQVSVNGLTGYVYRAYLQY